jgi:hypothetical protein
MTKESAMEVILSAIAIVTAAGCFLAIVASDLRENDRLFLLQDAVWSPTQDIHKADRR